MKRVQQMQRFPPFSVTANDSLDSLLPFSLVGDIHLLSYFQNIIS